MYTSEPRHDHVIFAFIASLVAMSELALLLFGIASLGIWLWFVEVRISSTL
jgi:hypothetical protein